MIDWEEYVLKEREKLSQNASKLQQYIEEMGIPLAKLEELSTMELTGLDPSILQEIESVGGMKLAQLEAVKPACNASTYRQRSNVIAV